MTKPLLSVVMAVYNGEKYVCQAIASILSQSFQDWELILVDDCSLDKTPELLKKYTDPRIRVFRNSENLHLAASLNYGLSQARGRYILRMDADDICSPDRFFQQVSFMEAHPDVDLSWAKNFRYQDGHIRSMPQGFTGRPDRIKALFLFTSQVMHNCLIARRSFYEAYTYHPEYTRSEDWNLWYRASRDFTFMQQEKYLGLYRIHSGQVTDQSTLEPYREEYRKNFTEYMQHMGMKASPDGIAFHTELICGRKKVNPNRLLSWFFHLWKENLRLSLFEQPALRYAFSWKVFQLFQEKRLGKKDFFRIFGILGYKSLLSYSLNKAFLLLKDKALQKRERKKFSCL